jgi:hypothetical protein
MVSALLLFGMFASTSTSPPRIQKIATELDLSCQMDPYHDGNIPDWKWRILVTMNENPFRWTQYVDVSEKMRSFTSLTERKYFYEQLRQDVKQFLNLLFKFSTEYRGVQATLDPRCSRVEKWQAGLVWSANIAGGGLLGGALASASAYTNMVAGGISGGMDVALGRWSSQLVQAHKKRAELDGRFFSLLEKYRNACPEIEMLFKELLQKVTGYSEEERQTELPRVWQRDQSGQDFTAVRVLEKNENEVEGVPAQSLESSSPYPQEEDSASQSYSPVVDAVIDMLGAVDEEELQQVLRSLKVNISQKTDHSRSVQEGWYTLSFLNHEGLPFEGDFYCAKPQYFDELKQYFNKFFVLVTKFFGEYRLHKTRLKAWLERATLGKHVLNLTGNTAGVCMQAVGHPVVASGVTLATNVIDGGADQIKIRLRAALDRTYAQLPAFDKTFSKLLTEYPTDSEIYLLMTRMILHATAYSDESLKRKLPSTGAHVASVHPGHTVVNIENRK